MQQRGIGQHRGFHIDHMWEHFVAHLNELERGLGNLGTGGCDRGHGVSDVQDLAARHAVVRQRAQRGRPLAAFNGHVGHLRKVGCRDHCLDARKAQGGRGVDREDVGVRMRAALDPTHKHAGQAQIGAEGRAPCDLVRAIGANWPLPDHLQTICQTGIVHRAPPAC